MENHSFFVHVCVYFDWFSWKMCVHLWVSNVVCIYGDKEKTKKKLMGYTKTNHPWVCNKFFYNYSYNK